MGLKFTDLDEWRAWAAPSQFRRIISAARGHNNDNDDMKFTVVCTGPEPAVLIAYGSNSPSIKASLFEPVRELLRRSIQVALLGPKDVVHAALPQLRKTDCIDLQSDELRSVSSVLASGHFDPVGWLAYTWARARDLPYCVAQHGLLTALAPPLLPGCHLFSLSEEDAEFWIGKTKNITAQAVGLQSFWQARHNRSEVSASDSNLTYLGQLHGREIPRLEMVYQAIQFCRQNPDVVYRPHPSEVDLLSRNIHNILARRVRIDHSGKPLCEGTGGVVAVFSTGVLEAAICGRPAWVHHENPPAWLREFWNRYNLSRWGCAPTPPPLLPKREPALAIADAL